MLNNCVFRHFPVVVVDELAWRYRRRRRQRLRYGPSTGARARRSATTATYRAHRNRAAYRRTVQVLGRDRYAHTGNGLVGQISSVEPHRSRRLLRSVIIIAIIIIIIIIDLCCSDHRVTACILSYLQKKTISWLLFITKLWLWKLEINLHNFSILGHFLHVSFTHLTLSLIHI